LLKVLSRITEPTAGRVRIRGRVASLLEVGTGFHPELTGRENTYLNGAILGMTRKEVDRKFDEIVDFSGVEKYIDTPVKRYSSGMYVRLAFAVAAHLETEVLLVDEVLAVGDAQFQKKCLEKIGDVAKAGRTILFVSHNMAAIANLCNSAILLGNGQIAAHGDCDSVISRYLGAGSAQLDQAIDLRRHRPSWASPWIASARILDSQGKEQSSFALQADLMIEITFQSPNSTRLKSPVMGVVINHLSRGVVGGVNTRMTGLDNGGGPFHSGTFRCTLKELPFLQGTYTADIWLGDGPDDVDCLAGCLKFTIEDSDLYGTGKTPFSHMGVAFLKAEWRLSKQ